MTAPREITIEEIDAFERGSPYDTVFRKALCAAARRAVSQECDHAWCKIPQIAVVCPKCGAIKTNTPQSVPVNWDWEYGEPRPDAPLSQGMSLKEQCEHCSIRIANTAQIASLIAERDATAASVNRWMRHYKDLEAERDKLLKDRSDLAQQIDNDTDCIARLKEADGLDVIPTLAAAYKEIDKMKDRLMEAENLQGFAEVKAAKLVERVSVLEGALRHILSTNDGEGLSYQSIDATARAALRTSECICWMDVQSKDCPVHGSRTSEGT